MTTTTRNLKDIQKMLNNLLDRNSEITVPNEYLTLTSVEDKIKCALKYMADCGIVPVVVDQAKDAILAKDVIDFAAQMFEYGQQTEALGLYTKAVIYAPKSSLESYIALVGRISVTFQMGLFERCLEDIDRIIKTNFCPDEAKSKLYCSRARVLLQIDPTMRPDVTECIVESHNWLHLLNSTEQHKIRTALKNIKYRHPCISHYPLWGHRQFLPTIIDNNPIIKGATDAIEFKFRDNLTRYIVAARDIEAGEALMINKAYASWPNNFMWNGSIFQGTQYDYCGYCTVMIHGGIDCPHCINVVYCDETCRDSAWNEHHDIECAVITNMLNANMGTAHLMSLRLTITAYKEAGSFEALKEKLDKIDSITDPMLRGCDEGVWDGNKYASVHQLQDKLSSAPLQFICALESARVLFYLVQTTDLFDVDKKNMLEIIDNKIINFVGKLIMMNLRIFIMHDFNIFTQNDKKVTKMRAELVLPFLNLFDHCCDPMTCTYASANTVALIALRTIEQGEEIFVCLGPTFSEAPTETRRRVLFEKYGFICKCEACKENWGPATTFEPHICGTLPESVTDQLEGLKEKLDNRATVKIKDKVCKEYIEALKDTLNVMGKYLPYPCKEIHDTREMLRSVYRDLHC